LRPLDGITVLDLTRLLPGAAATMLLANFGAEVIKIEEPGGGDYARRMPPLIDGEGAVFRATNLGKKSIVLDLKTANGKATFECVAAQADVLIEGFRPGVMKRLGLDYESLRPLNERLIYVSLTGYGQTGPTPEWPDTISITLHLVGCWTSPAIPGAQIADLAGGSLQAVIGILLALRAPENWTRPVRDVPWWTVSVAVARHWQLLGTGETPTILSGRYACYQTYCAGTGDGSQPARWSQSSGRPSAANSAVRNSPGPICRRRTAGGDH
jgi:crotonobetainyl-CoA:carnitine CoA-transferase CaiB-like acyl-CoA transferase